MPDDTLLPKAEFRNADGHKYTAAEKQALSNNITMGYMGFFCIGIPFMFGLAMMPFWDQVGDRKIIASINNLLAPAIGELPVVHQHALTQRRLLIGASTLLYLLFLIPCVFVLASKRRRFLYLEAYDLAKTKGRFYATLLLCWIILAGIWYLVFADPTWVHHNAGAGRLVFLFPMITLVVGQMSTFAVLGIIRDALHLPRYIRQFTYKIKGRTP